MRLYVEKEECNKLQDVEDNMINIVLINILVL